MTSRMREITSPDRYTGALGSFDPEDIYRIDIDACGMLDIDVAFCVILMLSDQFGGRGVLCPEFLPGITLELESAQTGPRSPEEYDALWQEARKSLAAMIENSEWRGVLQSLYLGSFTLTRDALALTSDHVCLVQRRWPIAWSRAF